MYVEAAVEVTITDKTFHLERSLRPQALAAAGVQVQRLLHRISDFKAAPGAASRRWSP
jgi:hypothetical protein